MKRDKNRHGGSPPYMPPWIYTVLGRRWFRGERKETAALISQSRRFIGARMCLLYDGFFSFAVVRQLIFYFFLMRKDNQSNQKQNNKAKYNANTSANGGRYRHLIVSGFIREEHRHTICKATRNDKAFF